MRAFVLPTGALQTAVDCTRIGGKEAEMAASLQAIRARVNAELDGLSGLFREEPLCGIPRRYLDAVHEFVPVEAA